MPWLKDQPSLSRTDRVLFTQTGPDPQHEADHDTEMPVSPACNVDACFWCWKESR